MRSVFRLLFRTRVTVCLAFNPNLSEFQGVLTVLSRHQAAKAHLLCEVFWGTGKEADGFSLCRRNPVKVRHGTDFLFLKMYS